MTDYQFACPHCGQQANRWDPDTVFNEGTPYCSDACRQEHYFFGLWFPDRLVDVPTPFPQTQTPVTLKQLGMDDRDSFSQVDDLAPFPPEESASQRQMS
jgi:hypothetical protein